VGGRDLPQDVAIDDLWSALHLSERKWRIAYESDSKAVDGPAPSLSNQWERRTRNVAGSLYVFARRRHLQGLDDAGPGRRCPGLSLSVDDVMGCQVVVITRHPPIFVGGVQGQQRTGTGEIAASSPNGNHVNLVPLRSDLSDG